MSCLRSVQGAVEVAVKVVPSASRDRIVGPLGKTLKIQVTAPPEKGKANQAVIALLAKATGLPARQITVVSGPASPRKRMRLTGVTLDAVRSALGLDA